MTQKDGIYQSNQIKKHQQQVENCRTVLYPSSYGVVWLHPQCIEIDFEFIRLHLANITAIEDIERSLGGLAYCEGLSSIAV